MTASIDIAQPLPGAAFGATVRLGRPLAEMLPDSPKALPKALPEALPEALAAANGLLLIPGLGEITRTPELLVRLSRLFGAEVEDYRFTLTNPATVHPEVPEIFIVSNMPPVNRAPPPRPAPPLTADGRLPVQYPHRKGWHTDQSYRRPPPDISLFYAVTPVARERGQTLFASGTLAYAALPAALRKRVGGLQGIHAQPGIGRSRDAVLREIRHDRSRPTNVRNTSLWSASTR